MFSIRERLTLLGGRFEIDSAPGKGTRMRRAARRRAVLRLGQRTRRVLRRDLSKTRCDERQSPDICFFAESLIRIAAPEQLGCNDVLGTIFDSQLEASLNPVGATGEIAVARAAHRP